MDIRTPKVSESTQYSFISLPRGNVADGGLDVVGDPFDEVAAVLVLDVQHLLVNLQNTQNDHFGS